MIGDVVVQFKYFLVILPFHLYACAPKVILPVQWVYLAVTAGKTIHIINFI